MIDKYNLILKEIEKKIDISKVFNCGKYGNSWIAIKDLLYSNFISENIQIKTTNGKDIFSIFGIKIIIKSIFFYIKEMFSKKTILFLGASTGIFTYKHKIYDAYIPYYEQKKNMIYMLNCGNLNSLKKYNDYIDINHIIIENYLIASLKKIITFLFLLFKNNNENFIEITKILNKYNIDIDKKYIYKKHIEYIVGSFLYTNFFSKLNIKKAYIVSAYSKSDIVFALKSLQVEVVEIQHGIIGEVHRGYNYNPLLKNILPVPDKLVVYNNFWKNEVISGGFFLDNQILIKERLLYRLVGNIENELYSKYKINKSFIIFTGQGGFFDEIVKFLNYLSSNINLDIIYRPHPRESLKDKQYMRDNLNKKISIIEDFLTEELIKISNSHISIYSSCHFDAINFLDKTYIFDVMDNNPMEYYIKKYPSKFIKIKENNAKDFF